MIALILARRLRRLIAALVLLPALLAAPALARPAAAPQQLQLEKVVMLMRHGVRPPTHEPALPQGYTAQDWPAWPVPAGYLTPHGRKAMTLLGGYDRWLFGSRNLLPAQGCPPAETVSMWSDTDERTIESAKAWLAGFAPGCATPTDYLKSGAKDPLFSALRANVVDYAPEAARRDALAHAGGNIEAVARAHHGDIVLMQKVLGCCGVPICKEAGIATACQLQDLPTTLTGGDGEHAHLDGPIAIASAAAEDLLLEYAEGMPMSQVGWGRADRATVQRLLGFHALEYDIVARTPYVAARAAAPLARRIAASLAGEADAGRKLVVFLGHDDNIEALGGLLDLHWSPPGYPSDDPPPGAVLGFELLRDHRTGARFVQPFFQVQSMDQIRTLTPLGKASQPYYRPLVLKACAVAGRPYCPLASFEKVVDSRAVTLRTPAAAGQVR